MTRKLNLKGVIASTLATSGAPDFSSPPGGGGVGSVVPPDGFSAALGALRASLQSADEAIKALKLGVGAKVAIDSEEETPWSTYLAYGQYDGKRCLHIVIEHHYSEAGEFEQEPLEKQSIYVRELAAAAVPRLVEAMRARRAKRSSEIQASADSLDNYLLDLDAGKS